MTKAENGKKATQQEHEIVSDIKNRTGFYSLYKKLFGDIGCDIDEYDIQVAGGCKKQQGERALRLGTGANAQSRVSRAPAPSSRRGGSQRLKVSGPAHASRHPLTYFQ